jgi:hypothetical protein
MQNCIPVIPRSSCRHEMPVAKFHEMERLLNLTTIPDGLGPMAGQLGQAPNATSHQGSAVSRTLRI